jgi:hypothetical protein
MSKQKQPRLSPDEVEDWLAENHSDLAQSVEQDRHWIWLAGVNLQGDEHKEKRESLRNMNGPKQGFRFASHGDHTLPSGETARWYYWTNIPPRFKRSGKGGKGKEQTTTDEAALLAQLLKEQ